MDFWAQAIGIAAMVGNIISYQFKSKKTLLFIQFISASLFAVNMFMLDALMGGILNIVGMARALVYMNKEKIKIPIKLVNFIFIILYPLSVLLFFVCYIAFSVTESVHKSRLNYKSRCQCVISLEYLQGSYK